MTELSESPASPASNSSLAPAGETLAEEQDALITKYIQACQAGDLITVRDLVGNGAVELGQDLDSGGVSGLHWAAINNRLSVVRYLVEQGAAVDLAGGELRATPLQWACRYGLVYVVDFLLSAGADPLLTDSQGFNALHLAVHSSNVMLVIYMLVFGALKEVDAPDPHGRTALHWAAYQGDSLSVAVLLRFQASVKAVDDQGFTPLHWALIRGTRDCLRRLVAEGSDLGATTNDGKSCFDIAKDMNSTPQLVQALYESGYTSTGEPVYKALDERQAKAITFFLPYPIVGAVIKLLSDTGLPLAIVGCAALFLATQRLLTSILLPCYDRTSSAFLSSPFLAGLFSASTFWISVVWITRLLPLTIFEAPLTNLIFCATTSVVIYAFQRSMLRNPGIVEPPESNDITKESIKELLKTGKYDAKHFCIHTLVRKPVRAKYSAFLKRCVVRFDHTCPWVYNDIGLRNHKVFVLFVISLWFDILVLFRLVFVYFEQLEDDNDDIQCLIFEDELCAGWSYARFTFLLTAWAGFQFIWVSFLLFSQCFQITRGVTTLELTVLTRPSSLGENPYYSSAPAELLGSDSATLGPQGSSQQPQKRTCTGAFCLVTGLNQFAIAVKQAFGIKDNSSVMEVPMDYGVKQNCIDFWFAAGDDHLKLRNLFKLPVKDEATLNGVTVNYYTLYSLPEKRPTYETTV